MYTINRTDKQNTPTSAGPILEVVKNVRNEQNLIYKTHKLDLLQDQRFSQFLNYVAKVSDDNEDDGNNNSSNNNNNINKIDLA